MRVYDWINGSDGLITVQVYKSASKRKAHILKNHPGAELPPSIRKLRPAAPGEPDPMLSTHTQLTGTIASAPVCCPHCAKQYSSKVSLQLRKPFLPHWRWTVALFICAAILSETTTNNSLCAYISDEDGSAHQEEAPRVRPTCQHHPDSSDHSCDQ